ncbi:MAG: polysaccharide pyruvyl transferase CsaB [Snowella sp.]|nr:polysaccharide pyruvyl transferase CsaB [Snowella sp.]
MQAVICGYYGQGNGGDEALLVSLLEMLPPDVNPVVLSANPEQTTRAYGVESCPNRSFAEIFKVLRRSQVFIWGGGSLMQDSTSFASPLYYGGLMLLAQRLGLKTVAWGQGIGPLKRPLIRWFTKQVIKGCIAVSVRDQASAQLLKQWRIPATLAPDPVWVLTSQDSGLSAKLSHPIVAVNLRRYSSLTPERLETLITALVEFQNTAGASLLLIPFQMSQDLALAEAIAARLTGQYQIIQESDPRKLKGIFRGVDLTIGMRLHSLIMAASEGSRCCALSYDPKVSHLMAEVNMAGWELADLPTDSHTISQTWQQIYQSGNPLDESQLHRLIEQTLAHQSVLAQVCRV